MHEIIRKACRVQLELVIRMEDTPISAERNSTYRRAYMLVPGNSNRAAEPGCESSRLMMGPWGKQSQNPGR